MSFTRFSKASAVILSLCTLSDAWALYHKIDTKKTKVEHAPVELRRHEAQELNEKRQTTELLCPDDRYAQFLDNNPDESVQTFCNEWLNLAATTTVVEYTPTITITTSDSITTTITSTTRLITTETVTRTATTTLAPVQARAANIAAVAEDIFNSVVNSGVAPTAVLTADNGQRAQAASGLANACSCKLVDPTSTVTQSYALPPAYTTVGYRVIILSASTETRRFTVATTVTETPGASLSSAPPSSVTPASNASDANGPGYGSGESSTFSVETAVLPLQITETSAGPVATPSANLTAPVVAAVPFSCPDAANTQVDQVVGGFKLDYLIYCNTEITSEDRIGAPIDTDSETTCAAQCSVLNSRDGQGACKAAAWTPYTDGRAGGSCVLSGNNTEYATKPGSVAIVNTGISSNGDCAALDAANANRTIDTSALAASITQGVSVSTPGLLTQTVGGGVYQTYVSANSTDAGGTVHWSWYAVSASSSFWEAVYATSWSCTRTVVQTIVQQPPTALPVTIATEATTTIVNGATTTIISGSSTRIIVNGGGLLGPGTSFVPATTTSGNGEITTFFSTATATSTGGAGIIPPTTGAVASPSLPAPSGGVYTSSSVVSNNGSVVIVVSGSTATYTSTGTEGLIPPWPSAPEVDLSTTTTTTTLGYNGSVSGGTSTYFSTDGNGVIPPASVFLNSTEVVSVGSTIIVISGSTATTTSGSGNGEVPPTPSRSVLTVVETVSLGSVNITIASSTATANSTGGEGIVPPPTPSPSGPVTIVESVSVGSANFTVGSSTVTANSTGGEGIVPPPTPSPSGPVTIVETVSLGSVNFTVRSSTFAANSTGGEGVVPPQSTGSTGTNSDAPRSPFPLTSSSTAPSGPSTTTTTTTLSSIVPTSASNISSNALSTETPGFNIQVITSSGVEIISIGGSTAVSTSTDVSGVIPPPSSASGIFPNITVSSGIETFSTSGSTYTVTSTGASGLIPPASANATTSIPASVTPTPEIDISSTGEIVQITISGSTYTSSATANSGIITPSANSTAPIASASTGSTGTNSDAPRSPFPLTSSSTPVGSASSPAPSSNATTPVGTISSAAPSLNSTTVVVSSSITLVIPPSIPSSNVTTSRGSTGTNSGANRTPFPLPSSSTPVGSATSPVPSSNSTTSVGTLSSPVPSTNSTAVVVSSSVTLIVPPSTPSANASTSLVSTGTNSDAPRTPFPLTSSTPLPSSGSIVPSSNASVTIPPSGSPSPSSNMTTVLTSALANSTTVSGSITLSSNSTITSPPSMTPSVSSNITLSTGSTGSNSDEPRSPFPLPTPSVSNNASSLIPPASANSTVPASSTPLIGIFTQTTPSGNTTIVISTSVPVPSASVPYPSSNITSSPPVTETVIIPPTGGNFTVSSATVVSVTIPSNSANITIPVTIPVVNMTTSVPSLTPTASANITYTPPFPTGGFNSSSVPSAGPTPSLNSTVPPLSVCPTVAVTITEIQFATSVQIVTTTVVSTVTAPAAIVIPASLADAISFATPEATSGASALDASSTPDTLRESVYRPRNAPASAYQREAACNLTGNIIRNPDFAQGSDGAVLDWDIDATDPNITLDTAPAPDNNGTIGQFKSAAAGRELLVNQALTLCPGAQYQFSASTQQPNKFADCGAIFSLVYADGTRIVILQINPEETWSQGTASFTAGQQSEADMVIAAQCKGYQGIAVSDQEGWMMMNVKGVSVVRSS